MFLMMAAAVATPSPCIGVPAKDCLSVLQRHLTFQSTLPLESRLGRFAERDVNGKPFSGAREIILFALFPDEVEWNSRYRKVTMRLDTGNRVRSLSFLLPNEAVRASSPSEYRKTRMFDYATAALDPANCPTMADEGSFYRMFHNRIRPTLTLGSKVYEGSGTYASAIAHDRAKPYAFCGRTIAYDDYRGDDTLRITDDHLSSFFYDSVLTIR